jgi:hypothetical protein
MMIRIRIVKRWIQIRIKVMRIRNPGRNISFVTDGGEKRSTMIKKIQVKSIYLENEKSKSLPWHNHIRQLFILVVPVVDVGERNDHCKQSE